MRKISYWKLGDKFAYITPQGKRGIVDQLSDVPKSAKKKTTASKQKKTQTDSPSKRRKKTVAKKKKTRRKGFKLPGGVGPKAVAIGALGLILAPRIIPVQSPGAQKLAAGLGLRALKIGGGGPLAAVGLMELAAQYGSAMLVGGGLPFFGPANGGMQGGTDY